MKTKAVTPQIASSREGAILLSLEVQRQSVREHYHLNRFKYCLFELLNVLHLFNSKTLTVQAYFTRNKICS